MRHRALRQSREMRAYLLAGYLGLAQGKQNLGGLSKKYAGIQDFLKPCIAY